MFVKVTDRGDDQVVFNPELCQAYWQDYDHVVLCVNDEKKIIKMKTSLQANWLVRAITEAIEKHSNEDIVDANAFFEKYHEEWLENVKNMFVEEEKENIRAAEIAKMTGEVDVEYPDFEQEHMWFLLRDLTHDFRIGLTDVLSAVNFAEECGYLPELPEEWWSSVKSRYPDMLKTNESGRTTCDNLKLEKGENTQH